MAWPPSVPSSAANVRGGGDEQKIVGIFLDDVVPHRVDHLQGAVGGVVAFDVAGGPGSAGDVVMRVDQDSGPVNPHDFGVADGPFAAARRLREQGRRG